MRQSKFPDTQIVAILKEPMLAARSMRLGAATASASSPPRSGGQVWWAGGGRCEAAEGWSTSRAASSGCTPSCPWRIRGSKDASQKGSAAR